MLDTLKTVGLAGFNRHGELPVLERWLAADAGTLAAIENGSWHDAFDELLQRVTRDTRTRSTAESEASPDSAGCLANAAIILQQKAGFGVSHRGVLAGSAAAPIRFFAEYDLEEGGSAAIDLAVDLLSASLAGDSRDANRLRLLKSRFDELRELARLRATPADTRALIDAARRRGIPFYRMDREPYDPIRGAFRLRTEGLLRLGQARHQLTVDGSFCIEHSESLHGLARDRSAMFNRLKQLHFPLPLAVGTEFGQCASPVRVARAARRIGFPVVLKTVARQPGGVVTDLRDEQALADAASRLLAGGPVCVEPMLAGEVVELLYVGQRLYAVLRRLPGGATELLAEERVPAEARSAVDELAGRLNLLCLSVAIIPGDSETEVPTTVIDVDPAPRLDRLLGHIPRVLDDASDEMMDWLFPAGRESRIPIAAITGTNGKTTTCFMVERIMREAGFNTGLACSTGSYLGGRETSQFEDGYLPGHLTVIDNPGVEVAILETTRGGAMSAGIGFDRCNVSACLNVSNDHLNDELGLGSIDELARVKQWIVERGRCVVLNADDPRCVAMADALSERHPVLVSCRSSAAELSPSSDGTVWVVESVDDRDWIVLHQGPTRIPIVAVEDVPTTFSGRAGHNTSNALHAAAIAHAMGADAASIAAGLCSIRPDLREIPGRLNHYACGGIDIIIDYAHNPGGLARLADFCDRFDVAGRRLVAVTLPANRGDDFVMEGMAGLAGRFDHYVCKNYRIRYGREPHEVPELLRAGLEREGVPVDRITMMEDEDEAIAHTLDMARPGDLVVLVVGEVREQGRMVEAFVAQRRPGGAVESQQD